MAKRKNQLADKLSGSATAPPATTPGWRDILRPQEADLPTQGEPAQAPAESVSREAETIVTEPPAAKRRKPAPQAQKYIRKTYLISPRMIQRINFLAEEEAVGINELVRYMMNFALDEIEAGRHELPTRPSKRTIGR